MTAGCTPARRPGWVLAAIALVGASCQVERPPVAIESLLGRTDSGRVEIVDVDLTTAPFLTVEARPWIRVGGAASPAEVLHDVRGATVLADGTLAVIDGSSEEVVLFRPDGGIRRIGGRGDGPTEFRHVSGVFSRFGAIGVVDGVRGRYLVLDTAGNLLAERNAPGIEESRALAFVAPQGDSGLVIAALRRPRVPAPTLDRTASPVVLTRGADADTLAWVRGPTPISFFGLTTRLALAGDHLWIGDQARREVLQVPASGGSLRLVRWVGPPHEPLTSDDARAYLAEAGAELGRPLGTEGPDFLHPSFLPSHHALVAGHDGGVWIQKYPGLEAANRLTEAGVAHRQLWFFLDVEGVPRFQIELPVGCEALFFDAASVACRVRDGLGVQTVQVHRLGLLADDRMHR